MVQFKVLSFFYEYFTAWQCIIIQLVVSGLAWPVKIFLLFLKLL
jgi:hypothetical protein